MIRVRWPSRKDSRQSAAEASEIKAEAARSLSESRRRLVKDNQEVIQPLIRTREHAIANNHLAEMIVSAIRGGE